MATSPTKVTEQYYNKNFIHWTERKTNSFHHEMPFTKMMKLWPERGHILDIGCAHGIHVPLFLGIGRKLKYTGIDISKNFLKIATRRYPQLTFLKADIGNPGSLPKKKFDGFWAAAVLMHVPREQWDDTFVGITTTMKPGALGYLSLPIAHPSGTPTEGDTRHFTILNEAEQRSYITDRGWKIKASGHLDGFTSEDIWRWYIVELPQKK